jgi:hypothetical protein
MPPDAGADQGKGREKTEKTVDAEQRRRRKITQDKPRQQTETDWRSQSSDEKPLLSWQRYS